MKKIVVVAMMLCLKQLVFAQNDMQNMAGMQKHQPVTYTCPMHPEIHASKPGNCPKCGMKLVKEKPKATPKKNPAKKTGNMDGMKMDGVKMDQEKPDAGKPDGMEMSKDAGKKVDDMGGMKMGDDKESANDIKSAKAKLGPIKTLINNVPPRTVRYDLYIADTVVNYGGKPKRAIAVNGSIPMPTLTFTEGDTAEIYVHNKLKEETSLHWHGLYLPNRYDGVPNLTQMPIMPGETHLYKFPIKQHGTHWYHSHTGLQEQIGMYGAFIMNKRKEWNIPTLPVVLSEWTNMNPKEVDRSLHAASDWFAIQKGTTQSYLEAIKSGHFKTKVTNEWKRMNAMDVSDDYDKFLINGKDQKRTATI
jgi:DNA-directed RNA polymerase subunit RPC12/RpoP